VELTDELLLNAVFEMQNGLIDADLGGGVVKKRIALAGRGKSGSTRTLLATNKNDRWFFIFGFEKNERENINAKELKFLKRFAAGLLKTTDVELLVLLKNKTLVEMNYE
ncbi:MAG: type II toxin-antitoxin system RelE/ParE family toxin, partial [Methylococcales bacterium]|nr:type II toxin-antitoxin system RelE/ParE family toxin [Methylococcales bacterium]